MQEVPIQELELEDRFSTHLDAERTATGADQDPSEVSRDNDETSNQDMQLPIEQQDT